MPRGRPRHRTQCDPGKYAIVPAFVYAAVSQGAINTTDAWTWAFIRLYALDREPRAFSPRPVDLSNREIAEALDLTPDRVRQILVRLEEAQMLERRYREGQRWLKLTRPRPPLPVTPIENYGDSQAPPSTTTPLTLHGGSDKEEELFVPTADQVSAPSTQEPSPPPELLGLSRGESEGGAKYPVADNGGNQRPPEADYGGSPPGVVTDYGGNQNAGQAVRDVERALRDHGVFAKPAERIAERMVDEGITEPEEAVEILVRVLAQARAEAPNERVAMARTVARLKGGDWDAADGMEQALERADALRYAAVESVPALPDEPESAPDEVALAGLWRAVLQEIELQVTRGTFDTWLADTEAAGLDDEGTLLVTVKNTYGVEWLANRLRPVIERALSYVVSLDEIGEALKAAGLPVPSGVAFAARGGAPDDEAALSTAGAAEKEHQRS